MKDLTLKEEFVELRAKGKSYASIAEKLGMSKTTLMIWSKELVVDIANKRQFELDALREKYKISIKHRLELYSKQLEAISKEIEKRGLDDIPTYKLIELQIKLTSILGNEEQTTQFTRNINGLTEEDFQITRSWCG